MACRDACHAAGQNRSHTYRYNCRNVDATRALRFSKNSAKDSIPYVGISVIRWRLRKAASLV